MLEFLNESEENNALKMLLDMAQNEIESNNADMHDKHTIDVQTSSGISAEGLQPKAKKQKTVSNSDIRSAILRSPSPGGSSDSDATVDLDFVPTDIKTFESP